MLFFFSLLLATASSCLLVEANNSTTNTNTNSTTTATIIITTESDLNQPPPSGEKATGAGNCPASVLEAHNSHRARHGSPPLTFDPQVAAVAQAWADKLAASGEFKHSGNKKYGENIAAGAGDFGQLADGQWYGKEFPNYKWYGGEPPSDPDTFKTYGHFTALVWKATTAVGCGCADYKKGSPYKEILVCNYLPSGNVRGHYKENVFPPK